MNSKKNIQKNNSECPLANPLEVFAGQWKPEILWHLGGGAKRFGELRHLIPDVSPKMLTQQLRQLERDGLITRTQFQEIPPRVEYAVTAIYQSLIPVLSSIHEWGKKQMGKVSEARRKYDKTEKTQAS